MSAGGRARDGASPGEGRSAFRAAREPLHSLLAVVPLVALHALLVAWLQPPVRAAAAAWVHAPLVLLGASAFQAAIGVAVALTGVALAVSARRLSSGRERLRLSVVLLVWAEGGAWGLGLHFLANGLDNAPAAAPVPLGPLDELALALGAGIYEELVFRVAIHAVLLFAARTALGVRSGRGEAAGHGGARRLLAAAIAVIVTSLLFAAAHVVGPEQADASAFIFRFAAALFFTTLLAARGFGVTVAAHVTYDLAVAAGLG